jgi:antitoxin ParD1/3/4
MQISLTPELEKMVQKKLDSGLYNNASEVICEALRVAARFEVDNDWLRREAALGFAQLDAGEVVQVATKQEFLSLARGDQ